MNWNQIQYIITIKEEKTISRAAEKLFISQPSLSLSLKSLEQELGVTLFNRKKGEMELTYAGQMFYDWAVNTQKSHGQLVERLREVSEEKRHLIRVGISPHRSQMLMANALKRFYDELPECEVRLTEKPTYELRNMMEEDELDMIIDTPHPDSLNFCSELLAEEDIVLAVPESIASQLEGQKAGEDIALKDLTDYPFIMLTTEQVIGMVSRMICQKNQFVPQVRLTCYSMANAMELCAGQVGIVFAPALYAKRREWEGKIRFYPLNKDYSSRKICLVYPRTLHHNQGIDRMMDILRDTVINFYS